MEVKEKKKKYYTDLERYEWCRKCKLSSKSVSEFARDNNLSRATLRDWMNACNNINVEQYFDYILKNKNKGNIEKLLPYSKEILKKFS